MPTNENLSAALVAALRAAGYDPKTPEEWIMSAMDYLHGSAATPDGLEDILTVSPDANNRGITNLSSITSSANLDLTGVTADVLLPGGTLLSNVGAIGAGGNIQSGGRVSATTTIVTGDPGNGAGLWKLGTVVAGAVALDAANYIEVEIDGVVKKILIAA